MPDAPPPIRALIRRLEEQERAGGRPILPPGVTVLLVVEGSGSWQIRGGSPITVAEPGVGPMDCVLRCPMDVLTALSAGRLGAHRAFLRGRLQIEGDVGLALRLQDAMLSQAT